MIAEYDKLERQATKLDDEIYDKLKKSILQYAIQGKLVPQEPNDEPASVLLERIRAEKKAKLGKKYVDSYIYKGDDNCYYEKVGETVTNISDEIPFDLPENWSWIRLGYIIDFSKSDTVIASQIKPLSWVLDLEDIEKDSGRLLQKKAMGETQSKSDKHSFSKGNVLYSKLRPYLNKVIVADDDGYCTTEILAFDFGQYIAAQYAQMYFMSPHFVDYAMDGAYGVKMPRIGSHRGNSALMPLPPYTEQIHLVNRIDELFEQIDIIEQNQTDIDTLYDEFRKRTLTLAIQGKLVPQNPNDEPANVLLERNRAEKKAKLGKKYVDSYIYKGDDNYYYEHIAGREQDELVEVPFDIPDSWAWVRWGNLSFSIQYGYNAPAKESGCIKMVRISDIHNNEVDWEHVPFCDINETDIKTYLLKENDILFARTGGTVGKSYLVTCVPEEAIYAGYLIRTQYSAQLSAQYLKFFMESSLYWMQLKDGTIATAQPNCNGQTLSKMILPLPPLAEQKRIVAKINEMFAIL